MECIKKIHKTVISAKAGIQKAYTKVTIDSRLRGSDETLKEISSLTTSPRFNKRNYVFLLCVLFLYACTTVEKKALPVYFTSTIPHCQGYGCRIEHDVTLSKQEKKDVLHAYADRFAQTPEDERTAIAAYIGEMERLIAPKTGTQSDVGGTFTGFAKEGQMDCTDESRNTTTYLHMLKQAGLLRFHDIGKIAGRGFFGFSGGWPHQSAVIIEKESGTAYAVDSWFDDNGQPAHIIELETWKTGWSPETIPPP